MMGILRKLFRRNGGRVQETNEEKDEQFVRDFEEMPKRLNRVEQIIRVYETVVDKR